MDNYKEMVNELLDKQVLLEQLKQVQYFLESKKIDVENNEQRLHELLKDFESNTSYINSLEEQKVFLDKAMRIIRILIIICFVAIIPLINTSLSISILISLISIIITETLSVVLMSLYNKMYDRDLESYNEQKDAIEGMQSCIKEKVEMINKIKSKYPHLEQNINNLEYQMDTLRDNIWNDEEKELIRKREKDN